MCLYTRVDMCLYTHGGICLFTCVYVCTHAGITAAYWVPGKVVFGPKAPHLKQDHRLPTYVLCVHMCVCVLHFILYGRKFWREEYLADCSNNGIWRILLWQLGKPYTIIIWKWILVRQPAQQNNIKSTLTLTRFEP